MSERIMVTQAGMDQLIAQVRDTTDVGRWPVARLS